MDTFLSLPYAVWWYLILGAAITGYAMLDGFDLGVGAIHLFLKKEQSRRIALNAIGPVWDGNEVWLVITGGVLFAAFPPVYATLLSGLYVPFMLFLVMLIFRAISIEFRSKEPMLWWRATWDIAFSLSSTVLALALGFVLGNVMLGLPIDATGEFVRNTGWQFINPFSALTAITTLALFMMHGALFLIMKTEGRLYTKLMFVTRNTTIFFVLSFVMLTLYTLLYVPHLADTLRQNPWLFFVPVAMVLLIANITRQVSRQNFFLAFASSAGVIALMLVLVAVELFPNMLRSSLNEAWSLTVENASASVMSLRTMLIIAAIAVPLVGFYTGFVFLTFRGKVKIDGDSY
jgi:cytochrome d ubiquinol oxidase subunit II